MFLLKKNNCAPLKNRFLTEKIFKCERTIISGYLYFHNGKLLGSNQVITKFNDLVKQKLPFSFQEWRHISMLISDYINVPININDRIFKFAEQAGHSVETHFSCYPSGSPVENSVGYHTGMLTSYIWQKFWKIIPSHTNINTIQPASLLLDQNAVIFETSMRKTLERARELLKWEEELKGKN